MIICTLFLDYQYSLWGLPEGSVERCRIKREVHLRSAHKLEELYFKNGGIYIKLGQHIEQLVLFLICVIVYQLPSIWLSTLCIIFFTVRDQHVID